MKRKKSEDETINIHDLLTAQRKYSKKEERQEYFREHRFEILDFIIAVLALVVSVLGLFLPKD